MIGSTAKHQHLQPPPTTCWSLQLPFWGQILGFPFKRQESTCIYLTCVSFMKNLSINDWKNQISGWMFFFVKTLVTSPFFMDKQVHMSSPGVFRVLWICGICGGCSFPTSTWLWTPNRAAEALHLGNPRLNPGIRHESPSLPAEGLNFTQGRLGKAQISKKDLLFRNWNHTNPGHNS